MDDWFLQLTGFTEQSPVQVRENLAVHGRRLTSKVTGKSYACGELEIPSLAKLRDQVRLLGATRGTLRVSELVGDAKKLHADEQHAGAVFQVASQFNLLEMVSPNVTPEQGLGIYAFDLTQGPACAIACGAGTIYRNYWIELDRQIGQTAERQVDCLADVGRSLGNNHEQLWKMRNGYVLPTRAGLHEIATKLRGMSEAELDALRAQVRIGVHWDTQVTLEGCSHLVTQAYCSALPVAYSSFASSLWESFARLVLEAAYEATLSVAVLNAAKTGNYTLFLTLLGGGAFGNEEDWILSAIRRALEVFQHYPLDVCIVSFRKPNYRVQELVSALGHGR